MRYYLDHNATTPVDPRVLARFLEVERSCPGNAGSLHTAGRAARAAVEGARARIAAALGVAEASVVFTASGTEANNLAVRGLGDPALPVLLCEVEHPSVREPALARGARLGRVTAGGLAVFEPQPPAAALLCITHAQNEVGTVQDVATAARHAKSLGAQVHVDAAQSLGRLPLAPVLAVADSVTISPHKCGGLRGCGVWIVRTPEAARPWLLGGGQERGLRPGTPSPALCASAALAVELAVQEQPSRAATMSAARDAFLATLHANGVGIAVVTPVSGALPNTLMLRVLDVDGRNLLPALDLAGIDCSQGSACSSGSPRPPVVLTAMGLDAAAARACLRFSFGADADPVAARDAAKVVAAVIARLQKKI